jgi:hypothetical protein
MNSSLRVCHVSYHPRCLRIDVPFASRLDDNKGPTVAAEAAWYQGFICESCRVRAITGRALQRTANDVALLMLERATIVDIYNHGVTALSRHISPITTLSVVLKKTSTCQSFRLRPSAIRLV